MSLHLPSGDRPSRSLLRSEACPRLVLTHPPHTVLGTTEGGASVPHLQLRQTETCPAKGGCRWGEATPPGPDQRMKVQSSRRAASEEEAQVRTSLLPHPRARPQGLLQENRTGEGPPPTRDGGWPSPLGRGRRQLRPGSLGALGLARLTWRFHRTGGQGLPPQVGRASVGGTLCPGQSHLLNRAWLPETQVLSSFAFIECVCVQRKG